MTTKTTTNHTTQDIASALLSVGRVMNQVRVHEALCRQAGVDLDRGGAALLYKLHVDGDNARLTDLAERLGVDSPTVTRKVQQLERAGLLSRASDPHDARAFRLTLTSQGRKAIESLLWARQCWLEDHLQGWSKADQKEFARLLQLFVSTIALDGETHHDR